MSSFLRATTASTRAVLQAAQRPRISPNRISQTRLISASPVLAAKGSKKKGSRDDEDAPTTVILSTKGKGKSRHNHNEELVPGHASALEEVDAIDSEKVQNKMKNAVEWFRKEVASLESRGSGRVSTALLDPVKVSLNKGEQSVRLQEVATVSVREGNVLVVSVFEDETLKQVEKAIHTANIPHVAPQRVDARTIRIPIPKPTIEMRTSLLSSASKIAENTRIQVRAAREEGMKDLKKAGFAKDTKEAKEIQTMTDKHIEEVDKIIQRAKKELQA